jgi:hypothetical protein
MKYEKMEIKITFIRESKINYKVIKIPELRVMNSGVKEDTRTQSRVMLGIWTAPTLMIITGFGMTVVYLNARIRGRDWENNKKIWEPTTINWNGKS